MADRLLPGGAKGKRVRLVLAAGVSKKDALSIEKSLIAAQKGQDINYVPSNATVNELYLLYLSYAQMHKSTATCKDLKNLFSAYYSRYLGSFEVEIVLTFGGHYSCLV
ncbi:MAG: hypothetical protein H7844_02695 [Nitrospirae bacterium YQR-1]